MKLVKYDKTTPNKECAKVKPTKKTWNKKKSKPTKKEKKQKQQQRMSKKHGKGKYNLLVLLKSLQ